jgi:hypothetical protein
MLTESSYSAGRPLSDCNYIKSFRLDISRIDAPHHTTLRSALGLIASALTYLPLSSLFGTGRTLASPGVWLCPLQLGALNVPYNLHTYITLQGCYVRLLGSFLLFISSHRYCAAIIHTIVHEGICSKRDMFTKGYSHAMPKLNVIYRAALDIIINFA